MTTTTKCQHPADAASTETLLTTCPDCGAECTEAEIGGDRLCYDEHCPLHAMEGELITTTKWVWSSCPTTSDDEAMGADLVRDGVVLASCLWSDGELDIDSDGCGVTAAGRADGLTPDTVEWPSAEEARRAWADDAS